jgi:hypothetical protein
MAKTFGFPETVSYQYAAMVSKTRKLSNGKFEAVASIFFMGRRGLTVYAVADSRYKASREADRATESSSYLREAIASGRVSYSEFE